MAKPITQAELRKISMEIANWSINTDFGWIEICQRSKKILGYIPTRQALSNKSIVKKAYNDKSKEFRTLALKVKGLKSQTKLSSALHNERLLSENKILLAQLSEHAELLNRIIFNATRLGLKKDQLLAPLPKIYK